ncbi:hypothetical protein [Thermodesulfovibrio thiophilus]|nr:hypothetical protein [Thermodesulfovibrio thiophilus]HOA84297.1 hypothetical protein [Thermodesulfovibrio thiophilus]
MLREVFILAIILLFPLTIFAQPKSETERLWKLADKAYKEKKI